ncbi:MAG: DUF2786 domain-containing protein [Deltaproteobacteria bacterium]
MSAAEKVRKLAALAGSDNEHEANSAARQACRIIREGKVTLGDAGQEVPYWYETRAQRPQPARPRPPAAGPRPPRPEPRGPFARRPDVRADACVACGEEVPAGDAFSCADGYVHGDCVPARDRP